MRKGMKIKEVIDTQICMIERKGKIDNEAKVEEDGEVIVVRVKMKGGMRILMGNIRGFPTYMTNTKKAKRIQELTKEEDVVVMVETATTKE